MIIIDADLNPSIKQQIIDFCQANNLKSSENNDPNLKIRACISNNIDHISKCNCKFALALPDENKDFKFADKQLKNLFIFSDIEVLLEFIKSTLVDNQLPESACLSLQTGFIHYVDDKLFRTISLKDKPQCNIINNPPEFCQNNLPKILSIKTQNKFIDAEIEKINHITRFTEWTNFQKIKCVNFLLKFIFKTFEENMFIKDPHYLNVTFKYGYPIFLDFGSFLPMSEFSKYSKIFIESLFSWFSFITFSPENQQKINNYQQHVTKNCNKLQIINTLHNLYNVVNEQKSYDTTHSTWSKYCHKIPISIQDY